MKVKAELTVEVLGKDGERIYRLKAESKSFLQNFVKVLGKMLETSASGTATSATVVNTGGASATCPVEWYATSGYWLGGGTPMAMSAPDNDDSYGVVVGSSSTPVSPTDYALAAKFSHGAGSDQLDYGPTVVTSSYGATSSYAEIVRSFLNASGSDVTVREVGIIAWSYWKDRYALRYSIKYLIARDILPLPVKVPNLGTLTVRYRVSLSL